MDDFVRLFINIFATFLILYFIVVNTSYTAFIIITLKYMYDTVFTSNKLSDRVMFADDTYTPISIIVPAYNEEPTIVANIHSLLSLHYPEFEIIIVNDGSSDATLEKINSEFNLVKLQTPINYRLKHKEIRNLLISSNYPNLIVIDKLNGGKADSLNAGINISSFPIICSIDADSLLENNSLLKAVRAMVEDSEVVAAGGVIRVLNGCDIEEGVVTEIKRPKSLLETLQTVEYIRGFLPGRTAWNAMGNSLLIISGAFGLFRKDALLAINGFRETVGEDMDLVLRMHKHFHDTDTKYKVLFIPEPVCFTQVPTDMSSLLKQRNRWHRGLIDSLVHNASMMFNPKYGTVGLLSMPYFTLIEAIGPIIEFIGYITVILFYLLGYLSVEFTLMFFVVAILWSMWINIGSILLDSLFHRSYKSLVSILGLCVYGVFEMLGYRQLMVMERVFATFEFRRKGWGHFSRQEINVGSFESLMSKQS
jgi:cellulose synthase/poly-beta-1,6-N-acetylglucosamine synthase-like glycosyltransferase